MVYVIEMYAISMSGLLAELRSPTIDPDVIEYRPDDEQVLRSWPALGTAVSSALNGTGSPMVWPLSGYLHLVVRHIGNWYGALSHPSTGGDPFRNGLFDGVVELMFHREAAAHLLNRPLINLTWADYPKFGWLSNAELGTLAGVKMLPPETNDQDEEALWTLIDAVDLAAGTGQDLIAVYG